MGRARLLKSIIILTLLYGGAAYLLFFLTPASFLVSYYDALPAWMQVQAAPESVGLSDSGSWQLLLIRLWSFPVFMAWIACLCVGLFVSWVFVRLGGAKYKRRAVSKSGLGGCFWTMGELLSPALPHAIKPTRIQIKGLKFTKPEQALANEIMGLIAGKPGAYAGDGHGVTLFEHTVNVVEQVSRRKTKEPLLALAAMGHDLGKLVAYKQIGAAWQVVSDHGIASGRLLKQLPAFAGLDEDEAEILHAAVRYSHQEDAMPVTLRNGPAARTLIAKLKKIDGRATAEEKRRILETRDSPSEILDLFWDNFGAMQFYRKNRTKGEKSVGWRKGNRLYFNEHYLREWLQGRMERDLAAALGRIRRGGQIHKFTEHLLTKLDQAGMLVTTIESDGTRYTLPPEAALWTVRSGVTDFNGVFIVEPTGEYAQTLPEPAPFNLYPLHPATSELTEMAIKESYEVPEKDKRNEKKEDQSKKQKKQSKSNNEASGQQRKHDKKGKTAKEKVAERTAANRAARRGGNVEGRAPDKPTGDKGKGALESNAKVEGQGQGGGKSVDNEKTPSKKQSPEIPLAARQAVCGEVKADIFSMEF